MNSLGSRACYERIRLRKLQCHELVRALYWDSRLMSATAAINLRLINSKTRDVLASTVYCVQHPLCLHLHPVKPP